VVETTVKYWNLLRFELSSNLKFSKYFSEYFSKNMKEIQRDPKELIFSNLKNENLKFPETSGLSET
jgi:hypothetical protein